MSTFLAKKEDAPAKPTPAKSTGGAPMPPMPSFGQMKAAKDTMSNIPKPRRRMLSKASNSTGGAPMPPMPSFGQMKAAKDNHEHIPCQEGGCSSKVESETVAKSGSPSLAVAPTNTKSFLGQLNVTNAQGKEGW